ncbi:LptF/LptG family permease [candidate division KSB1 bacterium]|nr:LptF/LptG family permease [candidate division KSB1 bacterium]
MSILSRYIVRIFLGPFFFSLTIIVFLFMTNYFIKQIPMLLTKEVAVPVILELIFLNLAWIVALALPMAVLVATLMTFGKMSADNEITAMKASGYGIHQAMLPVLILSVFIAYGNFRFNDVILPEFNVMARQLYVDITYKKPNLSFEEGIFSNEDLIKNYRLKFDRIDRSSNWVYGVTIYDHSDPDILRTLIAEKATLDFLEDSNQIVMDLFNGESHGVDTKTLSEYKVFTFTRQRLRIDVESSILNRSSEQLRGDREKNIAMLREDVAKIEPRIVTKKQLIVDRIKNRQDILAEISPENEEFLYNLEPDDFSQDENRRYFINSKSDDPLIMEINENQGLVNILRSDVIMANSDMRYYNKLMVEIQKKYSIPAACIVFVFIGVPLGVKTRHGGLAIGGGLSIVFFLIYWAFLIGGEHLSDRKLMEPWLAMWLPNIIVGSAGIWLTVGMVRESPVIDFGKWYRLLRWKKKKESDDREIIHRESSSVSN